MNPVAIAGTFGVVWWLVFLMSLPFGVQADESGVAGADPGAPAQPHLLAKAAVTTVVAALLTWGIVWALGSGLVEFRVPRM